MVTKLVHAWLPYVFQDVEGFSCIFVLLSYPYIPVNKKKQKKTKVNDSEGPMMKGVAGRAFCPQTQKKRN